MLIKRLFKNVLHKFSVCPNTNICLMLKYIILMGYFFAELYNINGILSVGTWKRKAEYLPIQAGKEVNKRNN